MAEEEPAEGAEPTPNEAEGAEAEPDQAEDTDALPDATPDIEATPDAEQAAEAAADITEGADAAPDAADDAEGAPDAGMQSEAEGALPDEAEGAADDDGTAAGQPAGSAEGSAAVDAGISSAAGTPREEETDRGEEEAEYGEEEAERGDSEQKPKARAGRTGQDSQASIASAKAGLVLPKNPVPELQFLTFYSWWTELNTKRYMEICFDMKTELFQVILDKKVEHLQSTLLHTSYTESLREVTEQDTKVMSMHLHEKLSDNQHAESLRRQHLCHWDLHVGAKINILGRPTTLMQANMLTSRWLDFQADRLHRIKAAIEKNLCKYESTPLKATFVTRKSGTRMPPGGTDLRTLMNIISALNERLARYRPGIAGNYAELAEAVLVD